MHCPFHDDAQASGSIHNGTGDGAWLYSCHGCDWNDGKRSGDVFAIVQRSKGIDFHTAYERVVYREATPSITAYARRLGLKAEGGWRYEDAEGSTALMVVRFRGIDGKQYRPFHRSPNGWTIGDPAGLLPLYGLSGLSDAKRVYVVEGEKCVEAARSIGLTATTSAHGAKSPDKTDWTPLTDREVVILPDNDKAGREYAGRVTRILSDLKPPVSVKSVELPDLPQGGDIADLFEVERAKGLNAGQIRSRIEALADQADSVPAPIERGLAGNESGSTKFDSRKVQPLLKGAAGNEFGPPIPASELGDGEPMDWVWEGYLARGFVTLLTGLWKAGKTTLIAHLLRALGYGGDLGGAVERGNVLVICEEASNLWERRCRDLGIGDHAYFGIRPFLGKPTQEQWERYLDHVAALVRERKYSLVIFDTLATFLPVDDENAAAKVVTALVPLHRVAEAGSAVLLLHHPRKSGGEHGQGSRGSGALPGFVDIIVEFARDPSNSKNRRRVLKSYSRFDETPPEVIIELTDDGYRSCGTKGNATRRDRMDVIDEILGREHRHMTAEEILAAWSEDRVPKPGKRTVENDLKAGLPRFSEGKDSFRRFGCGTGKKNDPFKYCSIAKGTEELIEHIRSSTERAA